MAASNEFSSQMKQTLNNKYCPDEYRKFEGGICMALTDTQFPFNNSRQMIEPGATHICFQFSYEHLSPSAYQFVHLPQQKEAAETSVKHLNLFELLLTVAYKVHFVCSGASRKIIKKKKKKPNSTTDWDREMQDAIDSQDARREGVGSGGFNDDSGGGGGGGSGDVEYEPLQVESTYPLVCCLEFVPSINGLNEEDDKINIDFGKIIAARLHIFCKSTRTSFERELRDMIADFTAFQAATIGNPAKQAKILKDRRFPFRSGYSEIATLFNMYTGINSADNQQSDIRSNNHPFVKEGGDHNPKNTFSMKRACKLATMYDAHPYFTRRENYANGAFPVSAAVVLLRNDDLDPEKFFRYYFPYYKNSLNLRIDDPIVVAGMRHFLGTKSISQVVKERVQQFKERLEEAGARYNEQDINDIVNQTYASIAEKATTVQAASNTQAIITPQYIREKYGKEIVLVTAEINGKIEDLQRECNATTALINQSEHIKEITEKEADMRREGVNLILADGRRELEEELAQKKYDIQVKYLTLHRKSYWNSESKSLCPSLFACMLWMENHLHERDGDGGHTIKNFCIKQKKLTRNLSRVGDMRIRMLAPMQTLFDVISLHRDLTKSYYVALSALRQDGKFLHLLNYSPPGKGKSIIGKILMYNMLIEDTYENINLFTARAFAGSGNALDHKMIYCDEFQGEGVGGIDNRYGNNNNNNPMANMTTGNEKEAVLKSILSEGKVSLVRQEKDEITGKFKSVEIKSNVNVSLIANTNLYKTSFVDPIISRMLCNPVVEHSHLIELEKKLEILMNSENLPQTLIEAKQCCSKYYQRGQALTAYIFSLIACGIIESPTSNTARAFLSKVYQVASTSIIGVEEPRNMIRVIIFSEMDCIQQCIDLLFDSYASPLDGKNWDWFSDILKMKPHMNVTIENAIFGLTACSDQHESEALNAVMAVLTDYVMNISKAAPVNSGIHQQNPILQPAIAYEPDRELVNDLIGEEKKAAVDASWAEADRIFNEQKQMMAPGERFSHVDIDGEREIPPPPPPRAAGNAFASAHQLLQSIAERNKESDLMVRSGEANGKGKRKKNTKGQQIISFEPPKDRSIAGGYVSYGGASITYEDVDYYYTKHGIYVPNADGAFVDNGRVCNFIFDQICRKIHSHKEAGAYHLQAIQECMNRWRIQQVRSETLRPGIGDSDGDSYTMIPALVITTSEIKISKRVASTYRSSRSSLKDAIVKVASVLIQYPRCLLLAQSRELVFHVFNTINIHPIQINEETSAYDIAKIKKIRTIEGTRQQDAFDVAVTKELVNSILRNKGSDTTLQLEDAFTTESGGVEIDRDIDDFGTMIHLDRIGITAKLLSTVYGLPERIGRLPFIPTSINMLMLEFSRTFPHGVPETLPVYPRIYKSVSKPDTLFSSSKSKSIISARKQTEVLEEKLGFRSLSSSSLSLSSSSSSSSSSSYSPSFLLQQLVGYADDDTDTQKSLKRKRLLQLQRGDDIEETEVKVDHDDGGGEGMEGDEDEDYISRVDLEFDVGYAPMVTENTEKKQKREGEGEREGVGEGEGEQNESMDEEHNETLEEEEEQPGETNESMEKGEGKEGSTVDDMD